MKKINFAPIERDWLVDLLLQRIAMYSKFQPKEKYVEYSAAAVLKLDHLEVNLKDWEKSMCLSVTNEWLSKFGDSIDVADAYSLLNVSEEDRKILDQIDLAKTILIKLGENRAKSRIGHDFSLFYRDGHAMLNKLSACYMIYLSKSEDGNVYKIGFVHEGKEVSIYEMRHKVEISDMQFGSLKDDPISYGKKYFSSVTDKAGALVTLRECKGEDYPENQLRFFSQLLAN